MLLSLTGLKLMPARLPAGLPRIIGLLVLPALLVLGGCSTTRLGYEQAPMLLTWWLDGYLDLDSPQAAQARQQLQAVQGWHRRQELPAYVALLRQMQALGAAPVSAPQVCALVEPLRAAAQRLAVETRPLAASGCPRARWTFSCPGESASAASRTCWRWCANMRAPTGPAMSRPSGWPGGSAAWTRPTRPTAPSWHGCRPRPA